jgi:hypothetical protein
MLTATQVAMGWPEALTHVAFYLFMAVLVWVFFR